MPYWVYLLRSERTGRRYVGETDDLDARLCRHNAGLVFSTAPYRPWRLVYAEKFTCRTEARRRERFFKCGQGRALLKQMEANLHRQSPPKAD